MTAGTKPSAVDVRPVDLYDAISLEEGHVIALASLLYQVFDAAAHDHNAMNLNNAAAGLRVVADVIDDKVKAIGENTERLFDLCRGGAR